MSQTIKKDKAILIFSLATASTTVIAGILHLQMFSGSISHNFGEGILFLVGGFLQIFWAIPVLKRWGRVWQIIGIVGTIVFFILWYTNRLHLLPLGNDMPTNTTPQNHTSREFPRGQSQGMGIVIGGIMIPPIEMFQITFIGLYTTFGKMISKK